MKKKSRKASSRKLPTSRLAKIGAPVSIRAKGLYEIQYAEFQQSIQDAIYSGSWREILDEDTFIDWYWVNEFTKNHDANFQASCYFYWDSAKQKFFMSPPWDFDLSCGNIAYDTCDEPEGFWVANFFWYEILMSDAEFVRKIAFRWNSRRSELENSFVWLEAAAQSLEPAVMQNDAVWHNIGRRQWPHAPGWQQRKTYAAEVEYMLEFLRERAAWLDGWAGTMLAEE